MTIRGLARLAGTAGALAAFMGLQAPTAVASELHGESDAFAADGVVVAWGIRRAAQPDEATVVIRVARDAARFPGLGVVSVDPFGGGRETVREPAPAPAVVDVTMPRKRFADFPRTELGLYGASPSGARPSPALTVYYVGVPDTTPEFDDDTKLRAWLDERIARLKASPKGKTP